MWLLTFFTGTIGRWLLIAGIGLLTAGGLVTGGVIYGWASCSSAAEVRNLEATVKTLKAELARREARTVADNAARERDRAELERLDAQIRGLSDELQDRNSGGIGDDTARRLQDNWGR